MNKSNMIIINTKQNGVLVPLSEFVRQLPLERANKIILRDFRMHFGWPLGLCVRDFEEKTKSHTGIVLDSESFVRLAYTDMQIIDGTIEVYFRLEGGDAVLLIECVDATQWELSSASSEVVSLLERMV